MIKILFPSQRSYVFSIAEIHCIFNQTQFIHGHVSAKPSPDRQNGLLRFYKVGDQITLHCNHPDAEMEGVNRLTCTNGGKWNQDLPFCRQLPCSKIPRYFEINCIFEK